MKFKILLSAYACEPNKGSEPQVGWKWATTLSKLGHEVYVITRRNNKTNIENYLAKNKILNLTFIYFDYPKWFIKIIKGKSNPYAYLYFFFWQIGIFFMAKPLIKKIKFDFIHQVTFVSLRFPNLLCLYKIPFIFGPVAGGDKIPYRLKKGLPFIYKLKELLRDLSNYYIKISPLMNITFSKSYKIFVNTEETKNLIPSRYHHKTEVMLAIGVDDLPNINSNFNRDKKLFNICFAGNLAYWKGLLIVLKTFSEIKNKNKNITLYIAGSGPMEFELKKKSEKMNIHNSIKWLGQIKRKEIINLFNQSAILLTPSLRDSGGFVVLEAMSCGLPVATLNLGGPGQLVDNDCGIKINTNQKTEDEIVRGLSNSINDLIINNDMLNYKNKKSLERSKKFSWEKKALTIYKHS